MEIQAQVLAEDSRVSNGIEYVSVTCMEASPKPLLQMFDYSLRKEEMPHKGKLLGKHVKLQISSIRAIFSGRPQMSGTLELASSK